MRTRYKIKTPMSSEETVTSTPSGCELLPEVQGRFHAKVRTDHLWDIGLSDKPVYTRVNDTRTNALGHCKP